MIREWRGKTMEMKAAACSKTSSRFRVSGGGRKMPSDALDKRLNEWYDEQYEDRNAISRRQMSHSSRGAPQVNDHPEVEIFKLSKGWLDRFLGRHKLVLRRTTTVSQKPPDDYVDKVCGFILYVRKVINDEGIKENAEYGMDETAVWLDPLATTSIAPVGVRDVSVRKTGHDKLRITLALTAIADGKSVCHLYSSTETSDS